jgi:hypothetical protein
VILTGPAEAARVAPQHPQDRRIDFIAPSF